MTEFIAIIIGALLFVIFFTDAVSSSKYVQDQVTSEIPNMMDKPYGEQVLKLAEEYEKSF